MSALLADTGRVRNDEHRNQAHWERAYLRSLGVPEHRLNEAVQAMIAEVL